jgi:hypothetical protein
VPFFSWYNYCISGHYTIACFYLKHIILETGFLLRQVGPVDRACPYLQTAAATLNVIYKPYARVKANIKIIKKILHTPEA